MKFSSLSLAQICIDSIFPVSQEVSVCISQAADSIGLKEIPRYEVQMVEQYNWLQKTQVDLSITGMAFFFLFLSRFYFFFFLFCYKTGMGNYWREEE